MCGLATGEAKALFYRSEVEELKTYLDNVQVILGDDINVRDMVLLSIPDFRHDVKIPMVSYSSGELIFETNTDIHFPGGVQVGRKVPRFLDLEAGSIVSGLVVRKQYIVKDKQSYHRCRTFVSKEENIELNILPGREYPVYDILLPEGLVRFDLEGETYVKAYQQTYFINFIRIKKLKSLP